jgi:tRNA dimethylallyltransferase
MAKRKTNPGKYVVVIAGPTAVGKTDLSVRLAQHFNTEILSADSRQFFKEMTIGTAKPSQEEQQGVPHHFIDVFSISQQYSAGMFEQDALQLLQRLFQTIDLALVVGGSGLYVKALCEGMDQMPESDPDLREALIRIGQEQGLSYLLTLLEQQDPTYFRQVDQANPQRVIRALEVSLSSGKAYSSYRRQQVASRPFQIVKIGLNRDRTDLYHRIDSRVDLMLKSGLLEEARSLFPFRTHHALQTVGYQEIFGFLEGLYDWDEAVRLLKRNSRRYAKRQLTWFRKDPGFTWFHPDEWEKIVAHVEERMTKASRLGS